MSKRTFWGGHYRDTFVKPGERLTKNQVIATLGHTGYTRPPGRSGEHIHFVILLGEVDKPFYMEEGPGLGADRAATEEFGEKLQFRKDGQIVPSRISQKYGEINNGVVHYAQDRVVDYYDNAEVLWPEDDGIVIGVYDFGDSRTGKTLLIQFGGEETVEGIHQVRKGDTLTAIARLHNTTVATLVNLNKGRYPSLESNPNYIDVGWQLIVPVEESEEKPDPKAQPGDIVRISPDAADQIFGNPHLIVEGEEVDGLTWVRVGISDKWILDK